MASLETRTFVTNDKEELPAGTVNIWTDVSGNTESSASRLDYYYNPRNDTYYRGKLIPPMEWSYTLATQAEINMLQAKPEVFKTITQLKAQDDFQSDLSEEQKVKDSLNVGDGSYNKSPYLQMMNAKQPISIKTMGDAVGGEGSLRYPMNAAMDEDSDYVLFEFGQYKPPFLNAADKQGVPSSGKDTVTRTISDRYYSYNRSAAVDFTPLKGKGYRPIMLYMPQDVATEYKSSWQGKAFSNAGRSVIGGANGKLNALKDYNVTDGVRSTFAALFKAGINAVPGVAGNLSLNDITSSTRGIILNPNVEVLFDQPDLREFGLKFKMTPHDEKEAQTIRSICRTFQRASLPGFGDVNSKDWIADKGRTEDKAKASVGSGNFISVPHMCRVSFMKGGNQHPYLTQYKTCAISRVGVNYTPDGSYATYRDGSPVATELSLEFLETKLVFRDDITNDGPSL